MGSFAELPASMSDASNSNSPTDSISYLFPAQVQGQKRSADAAGLKPNGNRPPKSVKRRASKACQCCRSRKVRCNVVEHGAPCTNCRLDEVECIVSESKRKKKWTNDTCANAKQQDKEQARKLSAPAVAASAKPPYEPLRRKSHSEHVPHALYQDLTQSFGNSPNSVYSPNIFMNAQSTPQNSASIPEPMLQILPNIMSPAVLSGFALPAYIKPIPSRWGNEEITYLEKRGALTVPDLPLRNELIRCYVEFVHPYMPLLNIHETVNMIDQNDGSQTISLLLFQAMMFAGVAFADLGELKAAGYATRKDARREFFTKTRLLYDFDCEQDRIALIQSLLLMTYWYETPDDQKDSHHWMGIAVSLCHTIGMHRDPETSTLEPDRRKLWKRIWWSTYMRDRLIALGMRRPTRIKDTDVDVPMLKLDDFENAVMSEGPSCLPSHCRYLRSRAMQRDLAVMCIEKAKLCVCISHVLTVQYSVLHSNQGSAEEGSTRTTMMLVAKKLEHQVDQVRSCDRELQHWLRNLPREAEYVTPTMHDVDSNQDTVVLNRSLLHMVYYAALSALHRPQVLPSTTMPVAPTESEMLEVSRKAVRHAAAEITSIADTLNNLDLVRCFPTTGITVLLPAIIIHLLDIKAPDEATRRLSLKGFCQCMQVMAKLRDIYAAADYSTAFLEAAIRKAEITLPQKSNELREPRNVITSAQGLLLVPSGLQSQALTPPPDEGISPPTAALAPTTSNRPLYGNLGNKLTDDEIGRRLNSYLATTPPDSDRHDSVEQDFFGGTALFGQDNMDIDFDSLLNLDAAGECFPLDDGTFAAMSGESSGGFAMDNMDWMRGMRNDAIVMPV
ncbi:hypothetical protein K431DRAFT_319581 [Polychaeton citri CBS 116435]|uniref:Zn(2)-C6 fungal-type domain-containing protein n=1 Tax=Polychaeton citri CBS 116435 TaxID=1314669 RepID=A0A9P4QA69_9PEZI|nr:hypothetical protein K431DRAFT_319581 [Polychaeton citri CBS 116435]